MTNPPFDFIAKVKVRRAGGPEFCGTGILVSEQHLFACAHSLLNITARQWTEQSNEFCEDLPEAVYIVFSDEPQAAALRATVIYLSSPDIALIRLDRAVARTPVRLLEGLQRQHEDALRESRSLVVGFTAQYPDRLAASALERFVAFTWSSKTNHLLDIQVEGGRPAGMSGAAALTYAGNQWACFGMVYLGGESAPNSRLISASALLETLLACRINHPAPLKADECLQRTLGRLIQTQRLARGFQRHDLATDLQVPGETIAEWENDARTPAPEFRGALFNHLAAGDPWVVEEWQRLFAKADGRGAPFDLLARLRPMAANDCVTVVQMGNRSARRGLGARAGQNRTARQRFAVGNFVKLLVNLPWPAYTTFLEIDGLASTERSYHSLDSLLGSSAQLKNGSNLLPAQKEDALPIHEPAGIYCVIVIARRSGPFHWPSGDPKLAAPLDLSTVRQELEPLFNSSQEDYFVALCEYEIYRPDAEGR